MEPSIKEPTEEDADETTPLAAPLLSVVLIEKAVTLNRSDPLLQTFRDRVGQTDNGDVV